MESKYTRINFIIIIIFIISMIITTLQLFSLSDELILGVNVLSTDNIPELSTVLNDLYITVAISLIAGLIAILLNFKTDQHTVSDQHISQGKSNANEDEKGSAEESTDSAIDLDLSVIEKALKDNGEEKAKYTATLAAICKELEVGQGAIYLSNENNEPRVVELYTSYAFHIAETETLSFTFGEGLIGQVAVEGNTLVVDDIPENYINIVSGLGSASPKHLLITPLTSNEKTIGVVELASFTPFGKDEVTWIKESLNLLVNSTKKKTATDSASTKKKAE